MLYIDSKKREIPGSKTPLLNQDFIFFNHHHISKKIGIVRYCCVSDPPITNYKNIFVYRLYLNLSYHTKIQKSITKQKI